MLGEPQYFVFIFLKSLKPTGLYHSGNKVLTQAMRICSRQFTKLSGLIQAGARMGREIYFVHFPRLRLALNVDYVSNLHFLALSPPLLMHLVYLTANKEFN
jgi:hypothetical protein